MGQSQKDFLELFKKEFDKKFEPIEWTGGQKKENTAGFINTKDNERLRRPNNSNNTGREKFEIGDLRTKKEYNGWTIIIEYDRNRLSISNLLKYAPWLQNRLDRSPESKSILLCHFSSWRSYAVYRFLWEDLLNEIQKNKENKYQFKACQFDNGCSNSGDNNEELLDQNIKEALDWIKETINENK